MILPDCVIGRHARLTSGGARPRRQDSGEARRRRGSGARRQALPPHRKRRLPDHAADDRQGRAHLPMKVLAVASEIFPLVKTGGLADVAGALPLALADFGVEVRTLVPGYPAVMRAIARGARHRRVGWPGRRQGAVALRRAPWPEHPRCRCAASVSAHWRTLHRCGWHRFRRQLAAFRHALPSRGAHRRGRTRRLSPRPRSRPRLAGGNGAGLFALRRGRRPTIRDDHPQYRVPGQVPGRDFCRTRPAAAGMVAGRRRIFRRRRLPEGRHAGGRCDHHGQPDLCP